MGPTALHLDWPRPMIYGNASDILTGAIIPAPMQRIPSELRSEACLGESSTRMGDLLGSPRVAPLVFVFSALRDKLTRRTTREWIFEKISPCPSRSHGFGSVLRLDWDRKDASMSLKDYMNFK